jgi:hypothetical protein
VVFRVSDTRNSASVLIDKIPKNGVVYVQRQGDRIILVKLVVGNLVINVISAYAPQVGFDMSAKKQFSFGRTLKTSLEVYEKREDFYWRRSQWLCGYN